MAIVGVMVLQELLRAHGVSTLKEFYTRLGVRKQYAWLLWHSKIALSWDMAQRLHREFGISFEEMEQVERETPAKPRGRPPRRPPEETPKRRQRRRQRPPETPPEEKGGA
jgi:plasmid maintenance system antidote protein VapI